MTEILLDDIRKEKQKILDGFNMLECLTQKRMEMIKAIMNYEPNSIRALSRLLERNVKNVFEDLILLQRHNMIRFKEAGRRKRPVVIVKRIVFRFRKGD